jgi:hypothetical protein
MYVVLASNLEDSYLSIRFTRARVKPCHDQAIHHLTKSYQKGTE